MNLLEIRKKFIELSGRFDLVVDITDYVDNGADFYIREGSKLLDQLNDSGAEEGTVFYNVKVGDYYLFIPELRVVEEVWAYNSEKRFQLEETNRVGLWEYFPNKLLSSDYTLPTKYYPGSFKVGNTESNDRVPDFMIRLSDEGDVPNGIIFQPTDTALTIEVIGKFFSSKLERDCDTNFWSIHYPLLLTWASLYNLEVSYRNSEGAKDWMSAIELRLFYISKDKVDQDSINVKQMQG